LKHFKLYFFIFLLAFTPITNFLPQAHAAEIAYTFVEQTTVQSHTGDTNWTDVSGASISSGSFTVGDKYLILVSAQATGLDSAQNFGWKILHGSTDFADSEMVLEPPAGAVNGQVPYNYFTVWTAVASEGIKMQHKTFNSADTVRTDTVSMVAINLSDDLTEDVDWHYNSDSTNTDLSSSYSTTNNAAITIDSGDHDAGDRFLVLGLARIDVGLTATSAFSRIQRTGESTENTADDVWEGEDTSNFMLHHLGKVYSLGAASNTFTQASKLSSSNFHDRTHSAVFAINLDKFAQVTSEFDSSFTYTATTNFADQVDTASMTPDATGNFFIMGYTIHDVGSTAAIDARVQVDNTDEPAGQSSFTAGTYNWDTTDQIHRSTITVENLDTSAHSVDLDSAPNTLTDSPTTLDTSIVVFSMELAGGTTDYTENPSDALSITDTANRIASYTNSETDNLSITDSVTATKVILNTESDPISITDSVSRIASYTNTESDNLSITDSVSRIASYTNTESDPLSITDSVTAIHGFVNTESDPLSITDSVATLTTRLNTESDPFSITDSVTATKMVINTESDPLSITDSVTTTASYTVPISDALSMTDSHTKHITDFQSDPLSITDSMTPTCTGCGEQFNAESDPLSITDSVTSHVTKSPSDPISITDSITTIATYTVPISDNFSITDSQTSHVTKFPGDPLSITDNMTPICTGCGDQTNAESDPLSITDSITTLISRFFNTVDQLSITDIITATNNTGTKFINVTEAVNVIDQGIANLFVYEPTGKVIWFKVAEPSESVRGGVFASMCSSTEIVTGINGTGYVKCTTLFAPTNSTRGGVYEANCPAGEYVSGIDDNGDLVCSDPTP
jgi:hypothetical protein